MVALNAVSQAWVTAPVTEKLVDKALVLASSLKRVKTFKKLVAITTLGVGQELRDKLRHAFDLVVILEDQQTQNGWNLEDYAKVHAFSLTVFNKCVYLSPNTLVLKNCDDIFETDGTFGVYSGQDSGEIDPSVFLFAPSTDLFEAFRNIIGKVHDEKSQLKAEQFPRYLASWILNNIPDTVRLPKETFCKLSLRKHEQQIDLLAGCKAAIVSFEDIHPSELVDEDKRKEITQIGPITKFFIDRWWTIYVQDVKSAQKLPQPTTKIYGSPETEPIAVVGMSCRLPGANNLDEFWELLINKQDAIIPVPPTRWRKNQLADVQPKTSREKIRAGFLKAPIDEFDAKFFGLSPKEAPLLDPQQRLLHETTWEALEDAAIDPMGLRGTHSGVFVGSWLYNYKDITVSSPDVEFFRVYLGNSIAAGAARLSHFLELTGPSIATESGCSSAIVAVDMACKALKTHQTNLAIAAGVNIFSQPFDYDTLKFVLSPEGKCRTFDEKANGFARAEGCGSMVLKRMSDAIRDGDRIWGLIRGSAVTQEGLSKSLGTPTVHSESLAMELALKDAAVHPKDVSYLEAHGTGTPVGDPLEIAAITKIYSKDRSDPLLIGSVKTNVGHTEAMSGITGIIKVLLSMKYDQIPAHLNLDILNPHINLEAIPAEIPLEAISWPKNPDRPRIAGVSSFGISGTDGHAIIQEAPDLNSPHVDLPFERPLHLMKISAKCPESLDDLIKRYEELFAEGKGEFADVAFTANSGRASLTHRAYIIAKDFTEARKILSARSFKKKEVQGHGGKLCFLFTGQGSQYPGMARGLYQTSPIFKAYFDRCSQILKERYDVAIEEVLWSDGPDSHEKLSRTLFSQTSIFVVEVCLLKMWEAWGVKPDYVLGHSLGEFAAAVAAGSLTLDDALKLVAERSLLIDSLPRGKMLVIKADKRTVDLAWKKFQDSHPGSWMDYAALNSRQQTVVAGDSETVEKFSKFCQESEKLKTIILASSHAFHSRHMDPILRKYGKVADTVRKPRGAISDCKYISGMEGKIIENLDADYWVRHTREKVSFLEACKVAEEEGCTLFIEVGPHPVLSALMMMNNEASGVTCIPSLRRKEGDWSTLLEALGSLYLSDWKGQIDWKGFDQFYSRRKVTLPFYPFNRKQIWVNVRSKPVRLHPLVGVHIANATGATVFENELTLKKAPYVQDHVIGNTVIFPGAAFLEMCLSAGHLAVQGVTDDFVEPRRPIAIRGLKIASPLPLYDDKMSLMQTVVKLDDKEEDLLGYNVSVFRQLESDTSEDKWVSHASAKFLPVVADSNATNVIDIQQILENWEKASSAEFYEKLPEVGLRFGPHFQSLTSGWTSQNADAVLWSVKTPSADTTKKYLIHPVVADAMIQAAMLSQNKNGALKRKLRVPVHIGEFVWFGVTETEEMYIFCSTSTGSQDDRMKVVLVDGHGKLLASMSEIDLIETTVKLVEGMIQQQSTALPQLWEETWRHSPGPWEKGMPPAPLQVSSDQLNEALKLNDTAALEKRIHDHICELSAYYALNALLDLGWNFQKRSEFSLRDLLTHLNIGPRYENFVRFFCDQLANFGVFTKSKVVELCYRTADHFPSKAAIVAKIQNVVADSEIRRDDYQLISELGAVLADILAGRIEPLSVLFPENSSKPNANKFYGVLSNWVYPTGRVLNMDLLRHKKEQQVNDPALVLRVLEVGAGTGIYTERMLSTLDELGIDRLEYTYTDLSAAFFPSAEKKFEKYAKSLVFKKFNLEEDPLAQGFYPDYYDIVVACEVLHATRDIKEALRNIRPLLKPGGLMQISETTVQDPAITFVFGLLDGYWRFEDKDLRRNHATLSPEKWEEALILSGFEDVLAVPCYNRTFSYITAAATDKPTLTMQNKGPANSWLIFGDSSQLCKNVEGRLKGMNRKVVKVERLPEAPCSEKSAQEWIDKSIKMAKDNDLNLEGILYLFGLTDPDQRDQGQVSLPLVTLMQKIYELPNPPRVYAVGQGVLSAEGSDVSNPTAGTVWGILKAVCNENLGVKVTFVDLSPTDLPESQSDQLFSSLWVTDEDTIAFRNGRRIIPRLNSKSAQKDDLSLPSGTDRYQLVLPPSKLVSDLELGVLDHYTLGENDVEIHVKAVALNFRDYLAVIKPIAQFDTINAVGADFCGVISAVGSKVSKRKVGDKVLGMNSDMNQAMPSHIKLNENMIMPLPQDWTFAEGATISVVYATSIYCLMTVAQMKKGDIVLLHTASGGVGLSAINIAKHVGATVIATAGSDRKRRFLKALGIQHVFNSRNLDYERQILEVTNGRGVDIVLNSLTGPGFKEASLNALAKGGRFIEMSKLNVWSEEDVKALRPDVFYRIVDLQSLSDEQMQGLNEQMMAFCEANVVKPIPFELFDALNIRGALNYLSKAKHIGKIVCTMPQVKIENSKFVARCPLFNQDITYMITGGLGGIGFEVAKWMLSQGAKHLILASRSAPKPEIAKQIETWNKEGHHIKAWSVDIGNFEQCREMVEKLNKNPEFPPLRGIMHAAGVLSDAVIQNQSWEKFGLTYNAKVKGTWNLHDLTKDLLLEHFVLFSSIAALFGSPGQANHSASNCFEDSFGHFRYSLGLPATVVNWGNWGEVGVATELDFPGVRPISTAQGMNALEFALKTHSIQTCVLNVESFGHLSKLIPRLKSYVNDKRLLGEIKTETLMSSDDLWNEVDSAPDDESKKGVFKKYVKIMVRNMLKMDSDEPIDDLTEFQTLGVDSLMMLEMKNCIQSVLGSRLTISAQDLKDCTNAESLASRLLDMIQGKEEQGEEMSLEEMQALIREDSRLPEHIKVDADLIPAKSLGEIETILVTGVTGVLGPYLLERLSKRNNVKTIYCLVRKIGKMTPAERLDAYLKSQELDIDLSKVKCIEGDVAEEKFGLTEDHYLKLASEVDAIFHCAARVNHVSKYWKAPRKNKSSVRTVNVFGTLETLQFATEQKLKHVFYCSTLLMVASVDENKRLLDTWEDIAAFDQFNIANLGYVISKHISEQLVHQAVERGLPCKSFRFPLIAGDSRNGRIDVKSSHVGLRLMTYLQLGCMPDTPHPLLILPVDTCADLSLSLFFNEAAPFDVYNILNPNPSLEQEFVQIASELGFQVDIVTFSEFIGLLREQGENTPLGPFKKLYDEDGAKMAEHYSSSFLPSIKCWFNRESGDDFFVSEKVLKFLPGWEKMMESGTDIIRRDLLYLKSTGVLDKLRK